MDFPQQYKYRSAYFCSRSGYTKLFKVLVGLYAYSIHHTNSNQLQDIFREEEEGAEVLWTSASRPRGQGP